MTPHNEAQRGDYAEAVLLPGDPLRAEWIADTMLEKVRRVNKIRGALGYTGFYRGVPVSVQATGMGNASVAIYVHELLDAYRAKMLIRIGSCGGLTEKVKLRSIVLSHACSTDSAMGRQIFAPFDYAPAADFELLSLAASIARSSGLDHWVGPTASSDIFYAPDPPGRYAVLRQYGALAVDMETSGLYTVAARFGARALSICTVVDNIITGEETAESERQELFGPMSRLALDTVAAWYAPPNAG